MDFFHKPVLYKEVLESLNIKKDGVYIDGTAGGGGHSGGIAESLGEDGLLVCVDRDIDAIEASKKKLSIPNKNIRFVHANYSDIDEIKKVTSHADGILLDLGVSSFQLDNEKRGFSYMKEGNLDMRMDKSDFLTAYQVVNEYSREELSKIIKLYGEEKWANRIAYFIENARKEKPIKTTLELSEIIKNAIPAKARRDGPHPAKRTFQAIRIEVNSELSHLEKSIDNFIDMLNSHGRLSIITFHSLEDRIVKEKFSERLNPCSCPKELPVCICGKKTDIKKITKKPITATENELINNPRARSAKLRVIEKL